MKQIIYYTDNRLDGTKVGEAVQQKLLETSLPIVSVSLKPIDFGDNYVVDAERGYLTMFKQILLALENSTGDIIYHCEHDCIYPPEHFDFTPPTKDKFYYDINWYKVRKDGLAVHWDAAQVSGLCYYRELGIEYYKKRIAEFDPDNFDRKFEPTVDTEYETWSSPVPYIDVRGEWNMTYNKWKLDHFRKKDTAVNFAQSDIDHINGWSNLRELL